MSALLDANNIVAGYGDLEILHGVSIRAEQGEITCLIGPNGSGKSTLLATLFGLVQPRAGIISFRGQEITGAASGQLLKLGMAFVLQRRSVFPRMTIVENLQLGAFIRDDGLVLPDIERVLSLFPALEKKRHLHAGALSGGEQRMLEMARVMMLSPQLILLDEPSAGLAPRIVDTIFEQINDLNKKGVTFIIVEQNVRKILEVADRGYLLAQGKMELEGPCAVLKKDSQLVRAYLSSSA
jgi:ABC-type branched-subunit amino acid transport system ATPase component